MTKERFDFIEPRNFPELWEEIHEWLGDPRPDANGEYTTSDYLTFFEMNREWDFKYDLVGLDPVRRRHNKLHFKVVINGVYEYNIWYELTDGGWEEFWWELVHRAFCSFNRIRSDKAYKYKLAVELNKKNMKKSTMFFILAFLGFILGS